MSDTYGTDVIQWGELSQRDRENFTAMLNREFDVDLEVEDAEQYYGDPGKLDQELGGLESAGPECSNCFTTLTPVDIEELEATGRCPHCGHDITTSSDGRDGDADE
jgi:predicted RNA-binding Zn-ribbon protein involved in translation (DUF1610 family)